MKRKIEAPKKREKLVIRPKELQAMSGGQATDAIQINLHD